jgi:hypothetical protein
MAYIPPNPNGATTAANSTPVVIAYDQTALPIVNSQSTINVGTWTSATTAGTAVSLAVAGYNTVSVTLINTSTMTAGVLTFEASPDSGTTWFPITMVRTDSYTSELTSTLNTAPITRAWWGTVAAFTNYRVRLSTAITGTGTATVKVTTQSAPAQSVITVGQATAASLNATVTGTVTTNVAAGTNVIGKVNIAAQTTGGATSFTLISAATTNATVVKASAGTLYMLTATNNGSSVAFVKFYNKTTAPTVGTDTPVLTFMLPAGGGIAVPLPASGIAFATGISYAITGLATLADTTAVALSQIQLNGAFL